MTLSLEQWHERYQEQAKWTKNVRDYLYNRIDLKRVLAKHLIYAREDQIVGRELVILVKR